MFSPTATPAARGLPLSLRMACNAPVVRLAGRAPVPARAGVAVHTEARGGFAVRLWVRPEASAGPSVFAPSEPAADLAVVEAQIEEAVRFGESLGFAFEPQPLPDERVLAAWSALSGEPAAAGRSRPLPPRSTSARHRRRGEPGAVRPAVTRPETLRTAAPGAAGSGVPLARLRLVRQPPPEPGERPAALLRVLGAF